MNKITVKNSLYVSPIAPNITTHYRLAWYHELSPCGKFSQLVRLVSRSLCQSDNLTQSPNVNRALIYEEEPRAKSNPRDAMYYPRCRTGRYGTMYNNSRKITFYERKKGDAVQARARTRGLGEGEGRKRRRTGTFTLETTARRSGRDKSPLLRIRHELRYAPAAVLPPTSISRASRNRCPPLCSPPYTIGDLLPSLYHINFPHHIRVSLLVNCTLATTHC